MSGPCCDNCLYSVVDAELWRKLMWLGEPILPRCGNHPMYPGQIHEVSGMACPNYRRRPPERRAEARAQWEATRKKGTRRAKKKVTTAKARGKKGANAKGKVGVLSAHLQNLNF